MDKDLQNELNEVEDRIIFLTNKLKEAEDLAAHRLETIISLSNYLDNIAGALSIEAPKTPVEGIGAVWDVMEAIHTLQAKAENTPEALYKGVMELYPDAGAVAVNFYVQTESAEGRPTIKGCDAYVFQYPIGVDAQVKIADCSGKSAVEVLGAMRALKEHVAMEQNGTH